ncbi:MAG: hypothetical protein PW788_00200 [Micavibrio sp.]|nr:hypothetical protein [Micavibrio sp.]
MPEIHVEPLTKEIAAKLGHVAWIEEPDPVKAFRLMREALQTPPFNCAIWAAAAASEAPGWRDTIADWREKQDIRFLSAGDGAAHFERPSTTVPAATGELRRQFNAAAAKPDGLEAHMHKRIEQLFAAFPEYKMRFQLRAGEGDTDRDDLREHVDGGEKTRLRFLECITGSGTLIFRNEDMTMRPSRGDISYLSHRLPEEGTFTAYEAPKNSIVLLSNEELPWQPLLHSEPVVKNTDTQKPAATKRRTVTTYDCYK